MSTDTGPSSKHGADCLRRRTGAQPYLCTCGLSDTEVRAAHARAREMYAELLGAVSRRAE